MTEPPLLIANLGAEEGGERGEAQDPRAGGLAELWRGLFDPPAYPWLDGVDAAAWWNSEAAAAKAAAAGRALLGAPPDIVRRVHDKGWAAALARQERLDPPLLRGLPSVWDPEALTAPDAADRMEDTLGGWPEWARASFTLKPRIGTSARGRVAGTDGRVDGALRGAFERFARAGGAILEPWLERLADASTQLYVAEDGTVTLLGTLEIVASRAGVLRGHRGELDSRGRARSGLPEEEPLREAAGLTAQSAATAGYRGPCGVDAFAFRSPEDGGRLLRPLVELNARFTAGTVALGHLRRGLPRIVEALGLAPGVLFHFYVGLEAPPAGWPACEQEGTLLIRLLPHKGSESPSPGMLVARDREPIDALLTASE